MDPEIRELILTLRDSGLSEQEIVDELAQRGIRPPRGSNRTSTVRRAVRDREIQRLVAGGMTRKQAAEHLGVNVKTVDRAFEHMRTRVNRPYSPAEVERIHTLASEGMPMKYIAEDLGRSRDHLADRSNFGAYRPKDAVKEWRRVWGQIKSHSELLELHRQFHPTKERV